MRIRKVVNWGRKLIKQESQTKVSSRRFLDFKRRGFPPAEERKRAVCKEEEKNRRRSGRDANSGLVPSQREPSCRDGDGGGREKEKAFAKRVILISVS